MPNKAKSFELQFMCHGWHLICFDLVSVQWSGAWAGFVSSHVSLSFAEWAFSTTNETECTIWFRLKGVTYSHSLIHFSSHASLIHYSCTPHKCHTSHMVSSRVLGPPINFRSPQNFRSPHPPPGGGINKLFFGDLKNRAKISPSCQKNSP